MEERSAEPGKGERGVMLLATVVNTQGYGAAKDLDNPNFSARRVGGKRVNRVSIDQINSSK